MLRRIVQARRGLPPLAVHRVQVAPVAGHRGHPRQHRWRHEKRIAPPPQQLRRIIRPHNQPIQHGLGIGTPFGIVRLRGEIEICLPQRHIIRMRKARVQQLPVVALTHLLHGLTVARVPCRLRSSQQAVVERSEGPLLIEHGLPLELPVCDLLGGLAHRCVRDSRRQVHGQRPGIVRRIARGVAVHRRGRRCIVALPLRCLGIRRALRKRNNYRQDDGQSPHEPCTQPPARSLYPSASCHPCLLFQGRCCPFIASPDTCRWASRQLYHPPGGRGIG